MEDEAKKWLIELAHQVGKLAYWSSEDWRLQHPELMDVYDGVVSYLSHELGRKVDGTAKNSAD